MSAKAGSKRGWAIALTLACALLTFVGGAVAGTTGQVVCNQESYTASNNPVLCNSLASDAGWLLTALLPPLIVIVLGVAGLQRRAILAATLTLCLVEVGVGVLFVVMG